MWIDISNNAGTKLGPGPLINVGKWRYTMRLSRAGEWSFDMPASDPRLEYAQLKRWVNCYAMLGGVKTWFGGGVLEKRVLSLHGRAVPTMVLSGNDTLYELARNTLRLEIGYNSPYLGAATYDRIMAAAPTGWTYSVTGSTPNMTVRFVDESILNALTTIGEKTGQMFRLAQPAYDDTVAKSLLIFSDIAPSGIVATNLASPQAIDRNPYACLIVDIDQTEDASSMVNLLTPYGAGTGQARLTTACASAWPDGTASNTQYTTTDDLGREHRFLVDQVQNFVLDIGSFTNYGQYSGQVQYKDITPVTNNSGDMTAAANALLAAAVRYLLNSSIPQEHYALSVAGLRTMVYPGQSIRVEARQMRDGKTPIDIDQDLIIQEVTVEIDKDGIRPVSLTVATTREFAQSDAQILVKEIQKSQAYQSHPQTGPNSFTCSYEQDIDDDYGASFPFWLSRDTAQVNSVIVRFTLSKLRSTVKSVGGKVDAHFNLPDHEHTLGDHHHTVPNHTHKTTINESGGSWGDVGLLAPSGGASFLIHDVVGGGPVDVFTNSSSGQVTSDGNSTIAVGGGAVADANLDLSDAISTQYGIYEDPDAAHAVNELRWTVNGAALATTPTNIGSGWYELDITNYIIDSTLSRRPTFRANTVTVAVANPETDPDLKKRVRVTAQIEIRNIIQSLAAV